MKTIDLNGKWQLVQKDKKISVPATVPGCVHTDLLASKVIPDPYVRDNENALHWIGESEWIYSRKFQTAGEVLSMNRVLLRCEGLDTLAEVRINGEVIGTTENAFRTWEFDCKRFLKTGENEITVLFRSVFPYIASQKEKRALAPLNEHRQYIRKSQCNFGWDWGPKCVTAGIWRDISIVAYSVARMADVAIRQHHVNKRADLSVDMKVDRASEEKLTCRLVIGKDGKKVAEKKMAVDGTATTAEVRIEAPELWWPQGMGGQALYDVELTLQDSAGGVLDNVKRTIGLRQLQLDRHPDQWGESFQFVANGIAFFAKGANWIPADTFVTRIPPEQYDYLLRSARDVGMNMIRVWGGGIYEPDLFYDLCDKYGITVWQDFMFACSFYPSFDPAFMDNVRQEVADNVKRLRHHACLALWCGNNEVEAMADWVGIGEDRSKGLVTWEEYKTLFDELIPSVVRELDPDRPYWPSSPHSPLGDRADHANPKWGDAHLWNVWHGRQPFEWYRTSEHRFCSEFGFQSFPEPKVVKEFTEPEDRNVTSFVMEHHQRSWIGNAAIIHYMLSWFRLTAGFEMTLWLSQILQGLAIKYAVEHWRRKMPQGMGTLYWQINDCWPVASWSSIDYNGNWKALHHMARRFYAPVLVSALEDTDKGTVELHVTSDELVDSKGAVRWLLTDTKGRRIEGGECAALMKARANTLVSTVSVTDSLARHGARNLIFWVELVRDKKVISDNLCTFARPKHLNLEDPQIAWTLAGGKKSYTLKISCKRPALWVWVESTKDRVQFSDNFVHLRNGKVAVIKITAGQALSLATMKKTLRVRSLYSTWQEGK
jgi:beta-mannosidase